MGFSSQVSDDRADTFVNRPEKSKVPRAPSGIG
jgi:hypothetical protein